VFEVEEQDIVVALFQVMVQVVMFSSVQKVVNHLPVEVVMLS
jgi:hypothetical protein